MDRYDIESFDSNADTFVGALNRHFMNASYVRLNAWLRPVLERGLVEHTCDDGDILANIIEVAA